MKCLGRTDLTLNGSFADMVLLPTVDEAETTQTDSLAVLTNPGQLHLYDNASLCTVLSEQEQKAMVSPSPYAMVIPTAEPLISVARLGTVDPDGTFSKDLSKV